jgi:hypothetical protein
MQDMLIKVVASLLPPYVGYYQGCRVCLSRSSLRSSLQPQDNPSAAAAAPSIATYGPGHSETVVAMPPNVAVGVALSPTTTNKPPPSDEQVAQQLQYQLNLEERSRRDEELARQYQQEENQRRRAQEPSRRERKKSDSSCTIS